MLEKCNQIWKKVRKLLKIEFDSKPVCDDDNKYIKTKIRIYDGIVNTNFHDKKIPNLKKYMFINNNVRFCYQIK